MRSDLGKLISWVEREASGIDHFLADPITRESGCADEFLPGLVKKAATRVELMLRMKGYDRYADFVQEVSDRTSDRWVYFHSSLGLFNDYQHGTFFDWGAN